jgi:hypothetical protein
VISPQQRGLGTVRFGLDSTEYEIDLPSMPRRCGMRWRCMCVRHDGAHAGHRRAGWTALKSASGQGAGHRGEAPPRTVPAELVVEFKAATGQ